MRAIPFAAALLLAGCPKADTDTDTDTDVDTSVTNCDGFVFDGSIDVADGVSVPSGDVSVGLFPVKLGGGGPPSFAGTLATAVAGPVSVGESTAFSLCLGDPPDADFEGINDDSGAQVGEGATYLVGAWVDTDGDGGFDVGEPLVGGSFQFAAFVKGDTLPAVVADLGGALGWNTATIDATAPGAPTSIDPITSGAVAYALDGNLCPTERDAIGGVILPAASATATVALMSLNAVIGDLPPPAEPTLSFAAIDASVGGTAFSLPVSMPPEDAFIVIPDNSIGRVEGALYGGFAWEDTDHNGLIDSGEAFYAQSVSETGQMLIYARPIDFTAVIAVSRLGGMGWQLIGVGPDGPIPTPWSDGLELNGLPR